MFTIIKKQTRLNKDIPFYIDKYPTNEEYNIYFYEKFVKTNKFINAEKRLIDNDLVLVSVSNWSSHSAFIEFTTDEYCHNNLIVPNGSYDRTYNIETEFSIIEE
jgi:hypothetical protein